jgi:NAD(P)-dependent dehydrogenase (short-subunit alcohol dehydrogenase family)
MTEKVAIVVGAGGELGQATAARLAASGLTVVAVDRSADHLESLPEGIRRMTADAADPAVPAALVDQIAREIGSPDVLVNTLGAFAPADTLDTKPDLLRSMLDVNFGAAFWLSQAVAPYMKRQKSGVIVHVTARPAIEPTEGMAAYSASKAALAHFTRILDVELHPHGIRVNSVAPLLLDTARNRSFLPAEMLAGAVAPEAIAGIISFLVSDAAAPISGAIIPAYG